MQNGFEEMFMWLQNQQPTYEELRELHKRISNKLKSIKSDSLSSNVNPKYYNDCVKAISFYMIVKYKNN